MGVKTFWTKRFRHNKRGGEYHLLTSAARIQTGIPLRDDEAVTVYVDEAGQFWVRPVHEFEDGRFSSLEADPAPESVERDKA